jgi:virulence factor Mce-like protein
MDKTAPSITRIVTMVLFALSCFGLLLFLWLSFGGTIPFQPAGYQLKVSFPYAAQLASEADVRISGVSVGKVIGKELDPQGNRTLATLQIDRQYAPLPQNTKAILRTKTILGETYVELTPGNRNGPALPDGATLPRGRVQQAIQLDDVFGALDPTTRRAFQQWQQDLAQALAGNGENLSNVLGNLPPFAADATDITQVLDVEHAATVRLIQNGGAVFADLSSNQAALQNLITTAETTFATTAAHSAALASTFRAFPEFLDQTKATMASLKSFSLNSDPVIRELIPVARDLGPTLRSVKQLAPDLRTLFVKLGPLITASRAGLPALRDTIKGLTPLLGQLGPFLEQLNPILIWLSLHQQLISDFLSQGASGIAATTSPSIGTGHYLRQFSPLGVETLSLATTRDSNNRGNTYNQPLFAADPRVLQNDVPGSWDCANTGAPGDGAVSGSAQSSRVPCWVSDPLGKLLGQPQKFPHVTAANYPG